MASSRGKWHKTENFIFPCVSPVNSRCHTTMLVWIWRNIYIYKRAAVQFNIKLNISFHSFLFSSSCILPLRSVPLASGRYEPLSLLNSGSANLTYGARLQLSSFYLLAREVSDILERTSTKDIPQQFQVLLWWNLSVTCYQHVYCITEVTHRVRCCVRTPDTND